MRRAPWVRTVTAVVVASFAIAAVVQAAELGGPRAGHRPHGAWFKEKLGLTDDQEKAIREIREQQFEARKRNGQALHQAQRELSQLVMSGADDATIQAKQTNVAELLAESVRLRVESLKQIAPILTPEQRQKFTELGMRGGPHPRRFERQS